MKLTSSAAVAVTILTLTLAGCAGAPGTSEAPQPASRLDTFAAIDTVSYDYEPVLSNKELAAFADIIVVGSVLSVDPGPEYGNFDDEMADIRTVVITMGAADVVQGRVDAGGLVRFIMASDARSTLEDWRTALPEGIPVSLYAVAHPSDAPSDPAKVGMDVRGLEEFDGVALYVPVGPQGVAVETQDGRVLWPWAGVVRNAEIAETLPEGHAVGALTTNEIGTEVDTQVSHG